MKKYHNKLKYLVLVLVAPMLYISGCSEDNNVIVNPPPVFSAGTANFAMYVSIGNSLTAGFQSKALSERDQKYSFPSMIAKQAKAAGKFEQPLIKNPGIGGRLRLVNLAPTIVEEPSVDPVPSSNLNIALARPYNNLGVPGSVLGDMADVTDFVTKSVARRNPFFALILRSQALGNSIIRQARNLQATFVTAWIGNNDVLGYATSGGTSGTNLGLGGGTPRTLPTETFVFASLYKKMLDSLQAEPRGIVVANIPDVSTIPFFTTIGPKLASGIPWGVIAAGQAALPLSGIIYASKSGINIGLPFNIGFADSASVKNLNVLFTLAGQTYAGLIGQPTGKFYKDNGFPALPPGIDTTKPFGVHPQNPFPDAYVLDPAEITIAKAAVDAFNSIIATEAGSRNIAVVDVNSFLKNLIAGGGMSVPGIGVFTSSFITGGTFSYDGVHPSSRGYGIIANEWIKVINQKFGANIPLVDLSSIPGLPIGKISTRNISYAPGVFNSMVRLMTGSRNWPVSN
ncbi:MAG TPA: hypothetical protein ENI57_09375 [Ignavibacteria bacterium]|nr:hypothetical protein [Ignavibacteria bacterium]